MNIEEIKTVFEWLEENINKNHLYYFKLEDRNQITAYFNDTNRVLAQFYIRPILDVIKDEKKCIKDE